MSNTTKNAGDGFFLNIHLAQYLERVLWSGSGIIHSSWFFFWNPTAGASISCGDEHYDITPDHAYLLPPYTTLSASSTQHFKHLYAHFEVGGPFERAVNKIYRLDPAPAERFYREHLQLCGVQKLLYWRIMLMEYLAMLPPEALQKKLNDIDERVMKVLSLYSGKWQQLPDNQTLARKAGMSENNFYRLFHKSLGISPQRYFMSMRLNAARNKLLNSSVSINDIAGDCGFSDRYAFSKAFKQFFGVAPGEFRKRETEKNLEKIL